MIYIVNCDISTVPELRSSYSKCERYTKLRYLIGRPQCNSRFCWQASLLHLRPSFRSTRMITRTIYVQDLSSGTLL